MGVLAGRGLMPVAQRLEDLIADSALFDELSARKYNTPIGDWHPDPSMRAIGVAMREQLVVYSDSMREVLVEGGMDVAAVDSLVQGYRHELNTVRGLMAVYYTVHARRIRL